MTTALMGKEAAMACTVAVETVIGEHYDELVDSCWNLLLVNEFIDLYSLTLPFNIQRCLSIKFYQR